MAGDIGERYLRFVIRDVADGERRRRVVLEERGRHPDEWGNTGTDHYLDDELVRHLHRDLAQIVQPTDLAAALSAPPREAARSAVRAYLATDPEEALEAVRPFVERHTARSIRSEVSGG